MYYFIKQQGRSFFTVLVKNHWQIYQQQKVNFAIIKFGFQQSLVYERRDVFTNYFWKMHELYKKYGYYKVIDK